MTHYFQGRYSRPLSMLALYFMICLGVVACSDGYPSETVTDGLSMSSDERIEQLNSVIAGSLESHVGKLMLGDRCLLQVSRGHGKAAMNFPLLRSTVKVRRTAVKGESALLIRKKMPAGKSSLLIFTTDDWVDVATFRSQINQLKARCARSRL